MDIVINLDKPEGITSHGAVQDVKSFLDIEKAGHTGTLDPMASGVMLVCTNKATVLSDYFLSMDKEYIATFKLGVLTDTLDKCGRVLEKNGTAFVTTHNVLDALSPFYGDILQTPPMYSAIKVSGRPLYKIARQGGEVERKKRTVSIYENTLVSFSNPYVTIKVVCSKGTYIRSLVNDIGESLGTFATLWSLRRTAVGPYRVSEAATYRSLIEGGNHGLISAGDSLYWLDKILVNTDEAWRLTNGQQIDADKEVSSNGPIKIIGPDGEFLGIGFREKDKVKLKSYLQDRSRYLKNRFKKNS